MGDPADLAARADRPVGLRLHARLGTWLAPVPTRPPRRPSRPAPSLAPGPRRFRPHSTSPRRCSTSPNSPRSRSPPLALVVLASRAHHRTRRARAIERWELRLGRDDLANPYRVQEAFEGIAGAIGVRWYERLWRGPEHFALEIHRLPRRVDPLRRSPRRSYLEAVDQRTAGGPLPRRRADRRSTAGPRRRDASSGSRSARSFVLSIQTTRNYEHAFSESLVALIDKSTGELSVQLVLTPAARLRAPARTPAAQAPRARAAARRPPRPRRARHRLRRRGQGAQGRARDSSTARSTSSTCASAARTAASVRRVAGLFCQLRSENELVRREMRAAPPALRRAHRRRDAQPAARAADRRALDLGARDALAAPARARQARRAAALDRAPRERPGRDRPRPARVLHARRARRRSRSRPATASTGTR